MDAWEYTEEDRALVTKYLSSPLEFPAEFKKWILDSVGRSLPPIPIEQLQGYIKTRAYGDSIAGAVSTSSTTFVDLGGPEVTGLPDGTYLVIHGSKVSVTYGRMSISVNGAGAVDADGTYIETGGAVTYHGTRLKQVTCAAGPAGNTIAARYRKDSAGGAGDATFTNPWLAVVRMK